MKFYFDFEFDGLQEGYSAISLGVVSENDYTFYCEFYDYDEDRCDGWIFENVINNLKFNEFETCLKQHPKGLVSDEYSIEMKNSKTENRLEFGRWLDRIRGTEDVELISDNMIPHDDKLMLDLFEGDLPSYVKLSERDMNQEVIRFCNSQDEYNKIMSKWSERRHNSLCDAVAIKYVYEKVNR